MARRPRGLAARGPLVDGRVGIYVCGPTPQSSPHIGHVRSAVVFDVLRRWLSRTGYEVALIRNVTDIDDKILIKSAEQGRPWYNLAYEMSRQLTAAYDALNVLPPTYEPLTQTPTSPGRPEQRRVHGVVATGERQCGHGSRI